jgi:hypothetical protein
LIRVRINELARPEQGLAANDIHRPGHRDVERGAAAVRHRIDLPVDGLRNVGKPAVRRLTLLRLTRDVLLAKPTNIYQLDVGRTVLGGSADGAVLISREGPLLVGARVTGLDHERGNRRRDFIVPASTNLEAGARTIPVDVYVTPDIEAEAGRSNWRSDPGRRREPR